MVNLTLMKGAAVEDPKGLFNSRLEGNARRAIDIREGDEIDEAAFKVLVKLAVKVNAREGKWSCSIGQELVPVLLQLVTGPVMIIVGTV